MPEIVEVKLLTDILNKHIQGKYIRWHQANNSKTKKYETFWNKVKNKKYKVLRVHQKGKLIIFDLLDKNKQPIYILNELRMTGRWSQKSVPKKEHRFFHLRTSGKLKTIWYSDYRGIGTFQYIDSDMELANILDNRGPDILSDVTPKVFLNKIKSKPNWQIVKAIIEQKLISGVGNWIKSDALYLAKTDPRKRVGKMSDKEIIKVYNAIITVIKKSLRKGGSSGYIGFDGTRGSYSFLIYGQKEVKEGKVKTIKFTDGRTSHWVPSMFSK